MPDYINKIIEGDTFEVLKTLPDSIIDLGVTSPPYNKKEKDNKGWLVKDVKYSNVGDNMSEPLYQSDQIDILNEIFRVTVPGGSFFYNHKLRWDKGKMMHPMEWIAKTKWNIRQEIIWDRTIAANIRGWRFWQVEERIYWLHKPIDDDIIGDEMKSKHAKLGSVWRLLPERGDNPHPAPFPIELPTRCIYSVLDESKDKLILDPYMGSGTTAIAAKLLGHNYIGIDISPEYISLAEKRIANFDSHRQLVRNEMNIHNVEKTFKDRKKAGAWADVIKKKPNCANDFIDIKNRQKT